MRHKIQIDIFLYYTYQNRADRAECEPYGGGRCRLGEAAPSSLTDDQLQSRHSLDCRR
jgi:hypothetical protein